MNELEELKERANELGYKLVKKQEYIALSKCPVCGKKPKCRGFYINDDKESLICDKCGLEGHRGKTEKEVREGWNKAVSEFIQQEFRR